MTNPFDRPDAEYAVLRNDEDQHSLWPAIVPVPAGWTVVHGPDGREECLDHVRRHWGDIRPRSVAAFVAGHREG